MGIINNTAYKQAQAKKKGFINAYQYCLSLVKKKGFVSYHAYREAMMKEKGFAKCSEYYQRRAKEKGYRNIGHQYAGTFARKTLEKKLNREQVTMLWCGDIKGEYEVARALKAMSGELYVVDHIVPLRSPYVTGLHVQWNLEAITHNVNVTKFNKVWEDMPDIYALDNHSAALLQQAYRARVKYCTQAKQSLRSNTEYMAKLDKLFGPVDY